MRLTYRVLAYLICGLVALQAASHAWSSAGIAKFLGEGGTFDMSGPPNFPEALGFMIHGMNGMYVIPIAAVVLLVVAFLAKIPNGVMWAAIVLALVVLQVALGIFGHDMTALAFLHGVNALLLFGTAMYAGIRAGARAEAVAPRSTVGVG
ncbi:hypothetical protein [Agrococcus sp. Ld7]|uniref:hypothetical protein n=1 Tax=Agrococcus sp. Ld7 TaxID=649148 RepID=UPI003865619F